MTPAANDLFTERKFGLFVHWGLYAIPAWHEQIQWRLPMAQQDYVQLMHQFNPVRFDPHEWIDRAQETGMRYLCFTTKHHDGFCMWNTRFTDYNIMNTPYGRDILGMLAEACQARDFGLCLYYSIPDWHHPHSINRGASHQLARPNPGDQPHEDLYIEYVRNQVRELCANYGRILGFFWDIPPQRREPSINELVRQLQPGILINNRGYDLGDFDTPERSIPAGKRFPRLTEACQSVGRQSWGYRETEDYYSHKLLMQSIDKIMAMGGNYLLNVGPKADGTWPEPALESLKAVGSWYNRIQAALPRAEPASHLLDRDDLMLTRNGNTLYVHLHPEPQTSGVILNPLAVEPRSARLLNSGATLRTAVDFVPSFCYPPNHQGPFLRIMDLPINDWNHEVLVVQLEFDDLDRALMPARQPDVAREAAL